MRKINLADIPATERHSPKGKYRSTRQEISIALGREDKSLDLAKRHPFDLTLVRLPPGASYCPYHIESAQFEFYLVLSGRGQARDEQGTHQVQAGDAFYYAPGEAHQLSNLSQEDLTYYVIADNPIGDTCYYPDSKKWAVPQGDDYIIIKGTQTDYYDGEE